MPDPVVAARETAVQAYLASIGFPTPAVRLAAPPGPDLDQAWMLMDLADGMPLLHDLSGVGAIARLPRLARSLPDTLARHAAALHRYDPGDLPRSSTIEEWLGGLRDIAELAGRKDLVAVTDQLVESRPPSRVQVICHGDLHPFNVLTGADGDVVLDWSLARVADPAYDVAYTRLLLANPPLSVPRSLAPILQAAGRSLANRFVRRYDELAARPVDPVQLDWFTKLQTLRVLAEVAEADGEVSRSDDHPFLLLEDSLSASLGAATDIVIRPAGR